MLPFRFEREDLELLKDASRAISIVAAVSSVVSLTASIYYFVRAKHCMDEIDASLPWIGAAAKKYVQSENDADETIH